MEPSWDATVDGFSALPVRVLRPPTWTLDPKRDLVALQMDRTGGTSWMRPRVLRVLEALADGVTLADLVRADRAHDAERSEAAAGRSVRALVNGLVEQGNLRIELPPVPEVFAGRFRVARELGRGGVGVVWLCEDVEEGGEVVVKHAWNWTGPLAERDARIRAESEALARLDHEGITRFVAGFDVEGRHHLARSFVEGEDLMRLTLARGTLDPQERRTVLSQVADLLEHMHSRGLLCLDLNPANFMLNAAGRLVLADVGHARALDDPVKGRWGVDGYTAPDLREGSEAYSTRADVYGLGALAWFLATGKHPSRGKLAGSWPDAFTPGERRFLEATLAASAAERPATPRDALNLLA